MKHLSCPYYESKCNVADCFCLKYQAYKDVQNPQIVQAELDELGIPNTYDSWNKIFSIQKYFAARFSDVDHPSKDTTDIWNKEYLICIEDEVAELFDYIRLYGESSSVLDSYSGLKKEVIDILHFVMDTLITGGITANQLKDLHIKKRQVTIQNDFFTDAFKAAQERIISRFALIRMNVLEQTDMISVLQDIWHIDADKLYCILQRLVLDLLLINRKVRECISWKHWKKPYASIDYDKLYNVYEEMFTKFIELAAFVFNNAEELIQNYILKNIENIRRQKLGY